MLTSLLAIPVKPHMLAWSLRICYNKLVIDFYCVLYCNAALGDKLSAEVYSFTLPLKSFSFLLILFALHIFKPGTCVQGLHIYSLCRKEPTFNS